MRGGLLRVARWDIQVVYPGGSEFSVTAITRLFRSNRSQAVRLPKAVAFPEGVDEVEVLVVGEARLIVPKGRRWASYFAEGPFAAPDFMADRAQPEHEERPGL